MLEYFPLKFDGSSSFQSYGFFNSLTSNEKKLNATILVIGNDGLRTWAVRNYIYYTAKPIHKQINSHNIFLHVFRKAQPNH